MAGSFGIWQLPVLDLAKNDGHDPVQVPRHGLYSCAVALTLKGIGSIQEIFDFRSVAVMFSDLYVEVTRKSGLRLSWAVDLKTQHEQPHIRLQAHCPGQCSLQLLLHETAAECAACLECVR